MTTQHIGAAGERLVQYRLLKLGIDSALLTTDVGVDLVVYSPTEGRATTVQVKTVREPTAKRSSRTTSAELDALRLYDTGLCGSVDRHPQRIGGYGYHWPMVDRALLEQVMKLDAGTRLELRDAIEASMVDEYLTPELAALLDERLAEDDAASQDYVSREELERQTLLRRAQRSV